MTAKENIMPSSTTYQSPFGSDAARTKLRSALLEHFHSQGPASVQGYTRWTAPSAQLPQQKEVKLLVGDPIALAENLKILKQYSKLLSQACSAVASQTQPLPAHAQPLSSSPPLFPRNLQWFEALSKPYRHDEADATPGSSQRIAQLIELHAACDPSAPPTTDQREQAYRLAKTLPHFDRDLTAFYYYHCPSQPDDGTPAREYDLHVAHSIMRLEDPPDLATLRQHCAAWRDQGLVHVLSVAAMHMPTLADWFPLETAATPLENRDEEACSLLLTLEALRTRPKDYAHVIQDFIDTQDPATPTAQAIATTLDRLAILMSVKSNADAAPGHDLAAALASFPRLETLEAQDLWCRIKPTLEQAMPPSILRVDPRSACIRKRVKRRSSSSSTGAANTTAAPGSW